MSDSGPSLSVGTRLPGERKLCSFSVAVGFTEPVPPVGAGGHPSLGPEC